MKKGPGGFSLIELLIVVAIILIIAAIAIPNLLRSRIAANQASAVGSLKAIQAAEIAYSATFNAGYTSALGYLGPPSAGANVTSTSAGLIDSVLSAGTKSGYSFTYTAGAADAAGKIDTYTITATPISSATGTNTYYTDQSGVIRQNSTTTAGSTDSPIAG